ncbi:hypothetical protein Acr_02g0012950 [Actinidia rufa]|uniref:Uncharacterized protein n=1 Tax=Actinidia rufa TaxID=165716 RepID=A0A7J0E9J6_9ERIC|nr:hypothetical protein Acr_02g0012950 [Actinidia rufa]
MAPNPPPPWTTPPLSHSFSSPESTVISTESTATGIESTATIDHSTPLSLIFLSRVHPCGSSKTILGRRFHGLTAGRADLVRFDILTGLKGLTRLFLRLIDGSTGRIGWSGPRLKTLV